MTLSAHQRLVAAWFTLSAITLVAWSIGASHGRGPIEPDAAVAFSAIAITLIKVRVIIREFMDVRHAPARLRWITDGWLASFGLAMLLAYFA
ncbi:cytochrome C oxidase subunit IV family protein [Novosphingobium sp. JCM 18896]|uniref:cytochrome C oxidase subunit IV family protein n=1 Tax=Novosphingobium sp. JCM 18896 TaxID=2989731 RepID=UPI0022232AFC|nr:cytochrome C oxidase subunit IV family protein [Novosphingobium sp. JCM 18896]MCW1430768.1 cytochrome C oxidase subunit IV family protein [Novosphingobium sp. JCM 18896]